MRRMPDLSSSILRHRISSYTHMQTLRHKGSVHHGVSVSSLFFLNTRWLSCVCSDTCLANRIHLHTSVHTHTRMLPMQVPWAPDRLGCCRRSLSGSARLKMTITRGARQTPQETQVPLLRDTQRSKGPNYLLLFWQLSGRE